MQINSQEVDCKEDEAWTSAAWVNDRTVPHKSVMVLRPIGRRPATSDMPFTNSRQREAVQPFCTEEGQIDSRRTSFSTFVGRAYLGIQ
jgi:hypothetical protein